MRRRYHDRVSARRKWKWLEWPTDAPGGFYKRDWWRQLERQRFACLLCGHDDRKLFMSRVIPPSRGGTNYIGNIVGLCSHCTHRRHGMTIMEYRIKEIRARRTLARLEAGADPRAIFGLGESPVKPRFKKPLGVIEYGKRKGFIRPDGRPVVTADPDACTCRGQGAHILGSPVCFEEAS